MLLGPDYIFKCKQCGRKVLCPSMQSGNTFGGTVYPDGKSVFPMMPEYPDLVKCKNCGHFFWLSKCKDYETIPWELLSLTEDYDEVCDFKLQDYCLALESNVIKSVKGEIYVRLRIWWAFNDRSRMRKKKFVTDHERSIYRSNGDRLLQLLNPKNRNQKKMMIELQKNLRYHG